MFRSAELGHELSKAEYKELELELRPRLLQAQLEAGRLNVPFVIVVGGVDGAGKSETVKHLLEWADPRYIDVHALEKPTEEERELPWFYRFWRRLPPRGRSAIFLGSWYTNPIIDRAYGKSDGGAFREVLEEIVRFEKLLADEGILVVKFWMHISKGFQKVRLERLAKDKKTAWRVTKKDWKHLGIYDRFYEVCEEALRRTSFMTAPWHVIEGRDERYRQMEVTRRTVEVLERRIEEIKSQPKDRKEESRPQLPATDEKNLLDDMDLTLKVDPEVYHKQLKGLRERSNRLARLCYDKGRSAVFVFEGCDAAGKGGAIRRLVRGMHPKTFRIVPVAAPTATELRYPYLWRFWMQLPRDGKVTIFDRSWYGRVLVERVEGLCTEADWRRAYAEIRDFEQQIHRSGTSIVKFWLQISEEEQLGRFHAREEVEHKKHKITPDDWRNRDQWPQYKAAVCDMLDRTHSTTAPWVLVEAEDKLHARMKVIETVCDTLEAML